MSALQWPAIRKACEVVGKTVVFRDASVADAEFILSLRTDDKKSLYLSTVSGGIAAQHQWLERYSFEQGQAYFIIEYQSQAIGTVRLYDARQNNFCWGSWILKDGSPSQIAVESALMVYAYAVDHLGFSASHFDVRKGNERVWLFHERFGARRVGETDLDYLYNLSLEAIRDSQLRYRKFLPNGVTVTNT